MNVFSVALLCFLLGVLRATASRDARRVAGRDFGKTSRDKKVRYSLDTSAMGHSSDAGRGYCRFPSPAPQRECDECFACRECSQCPDCPDCAICPPLEPVSATCIDGASTSCCSPSAANEGLFLFPDRCPEDWTDPAEVCAQLSLQLPAGATLVPDGSATTNGATYTPTKAAALLAIGNSRLCYSLHPNAMTGPVFTSCDYDGQEYNPNMFSLGIVVTGYSLVVGGDLILSSPDQTPSVPIRATDNVAVWGDLVIGRMQFNDPLSPLPWQINTSAMSMGVFTLGGNVIATPSASILIRVSTAILGNNNAANQFYFEASFNTLIDPSTARAVLNGHICDATAQIEARAAAPDGTAIVTAAGGLEIVCAGGPGTGACITTITAENLAAATDVTVISLTGFSTAVVQVIGDGVTSTYGYQSLTCQLADLCQRLLIFAFTDATEITVNVQAEDDQVFPIFAPVCDHVNIIYPPNVGDATSLNNGIVTGIGCNVYIYYNNMATRNFSNLADAWNVGAISEQVAIYCQCACDPDTFNLDTVATQCTPV
eukprot:Selendium_serpulae@DN6518_c2_g1_i9.p1